MTNRTTMDRKSERELVLTRTINGPARLVFGRYLEVIPSQRIVWTNEEGGDSGPVTTVTFEEKGGKTLLVMHELYPTKEALEAALASGEKSGMEETFGQLDELLAARAASSARS